MLFSRFQILPVNQLIKAGRHCISISKRGMNAVGKRIEKDFAAADKY